MIKKQIIEKMKRMRLMVVIVLTTVLIVVHSCSEKPVPPVKVESVSLMDQFFDRDTRQVGNKASQYNYENDKVFISFDSIGDDSFVYDYADEETLFLRKVNRLARKMDVDIHKIEDIIDVFSNQNSKTKLDSGDIDTCLYEASIFYQGYLDNFVYKLDEKLVVRCRDSKDVDFIFEVTDDEAIFYKIINFYPEINCVLIQTGYTGEMNRYGTGVRGLPFYLVNVESGQVTELWNEPSINEEKTLIVVASFGNNVNHANYHGLQVFQIRDDDIELLAQFGCDDEPGIVGWKNENSLYISRWNSHGNTDLMQVLIK